MSKVRLDETKVRFVVFNRMFDSVDDPELPADLTLNGYAA